MNDFIRDIVSDLLFMLVPFVLAFLLSFLSFFLERLHPDMSDTAKTYRTTIMRRLFDIFKQQSSPIDAYKPQTSSLQMTDASAQEAVQQELMLLIEKAVKDAIQDAFRDSIRNELEDAFKNALQALMPSMLLANLSELLDTTVTQAVTQAMPQPFHCSENQLTSQTNHQPSLNEQQRKK